MILHIPHSSTTLPETFKVQEGVSLEKEFQRMTDWFTDELFDYSTKLVFPFSRLYCDVERFREDADEPMATKGMGVCYTRSSFGGELREVTQKEKSFIKAAYYDTHHKRFTDLVADELKNGSALIVDCHSFSDEVLPHEESTIRPDICIGTCSFHTPVELTEAVYNHFKGQGYTVAINQPFAGTIVPLEYYKKDKRVESIMIEINRKLYLNKNYKKSKDFAVVKGMIDTLLHQLCE